MDQYFIFKTLLLFIVSIAAQGQLFDFLTGLQSIIEPYPSRPILQYDVTTRPKTDRQTSKPHGTSTGSRRSGSSRPKNKQQSKTTQNIASLFNFNINPTTAKPIIRKTKNSSRNNSKLNNTDSRISFPKEIAVGNNQNVESNIRSQNRRPWSGDTREKLIFSPAPDNDVTTKATHDKIINNNRRVDSGINREENTIYGNNNNRENHFVNDNRGTINGNNNFNNKEINTQSGNSRNPNVSGIGNPGVINNNNLGSNTFDSNNNRQPAINNRKPTNNLGSSNNNRGTNNGFGSNSNIFGSTSNNFGPNNNNFSPNNNNFNPNNNLGNPNTFTTQNPLLSRPGVKPAIVDVNRPPITNRPMTERPNYVVFGKPTDPGAITYTEGPEINPEIMTGPDEDHMSKQEKRKYIETAERMCDKYKSLSMKKVEAIPLVPSPRPVRVNVSQCTPITIPLVVGGKVATIREFPHMALLGWRKLEEPGYSWKCGGSLISDQFVLTAGHCSYQEKDNSVIIGPPKAVQLGSTYLDDIGAIVIKVLSVTRHPKYKLPRNYYDIALLKLVSKVTFSEVIRPACLGVPPPVGEHIIATGWGRTEFGGDQSLELRSVSLPVWDIQDCYNVLGTSRKLPDGPKSDSQICAGEKRGGKDTCQGDSGGPAQIQDGCAWRVVAVTSLGRSCGAANTPGLYALVHRAFVSAVVFGQENSNQNNGNRNTNNGNRNGNNENQNDYYRGVIDINNRNSNSRNNPSNNQGTNIANNNNQGANNRHETANNGDTHVYEVSNNYGNNNHRSDVYREIGNANNHNYGNNNPDYTVNNGNNHNNGNNNPDYTVNNGNNHNYGNNNPDYTVNNGNNHNYGNNNPDYTVNNGNNDKIVFGFDYDRQIYRPTENSQVYNVEKPWWT